MAIRQADVLIQAGHEGRKRGATGASGPIGSELKWNPVIADEATRILREHGITVIREDATVAPARVKLALFLHMDGTTPPGRSGASIGYPIGKGNDPAAKEWHAIYSNYFPYKWMPDNYTAGLRKYYAFKETITRDAELVLELFDVTSREQSEWASSRLKHLGAIVAFFVARRLGNTTVPRPKVV